MGSIGWGGYTGRFSAGPPSKPGKKKKARPPTNAPLPCFGGERRDPASGPRFAPGLQAGRVERAFEEAAAVQGVADRARAVVAGGFEGAVAAAPDVGGRGDRVGG